MIFVTIGNHDQQFTRLLKKLDEIALKIKEKIVIQRGYTKYIPKNCESFEFTPTLEPYYKKARIVLSHGGSSSWEFLYDYKKPLIIIPRQGKYDEHINNHQVNFAKMLEERTGVKVICNISELTPELLEKHKKIVKVNETNLLKLKKYLIGVFERDGRD